MSQNIRYMLQIIMCLPFLLSSSSSVAMFRRQHEQKVARQAELLRHQAKLQEIDNTKMLTLPEINSAVKGIQDGIDHEHIQELADQTGIPYFSLKNFRDGMRSNRRELLQHNNPLAIHDPNLPLALYEDFQETLKPEINPNSLSIRYENCNKPGRMAYANSEKQPAPEITACEALLKQPQDYRAFALGHEAHHVLFRHSVSSLLGESTGKDQRVLDSIIEREADIHAGSKNSKSACAGARNQCLFGHRQIIDQRAHCETMQTLCMLMRQKEKLLEEQSTRSS